MMSSRLKLGVAAGALLWAAVLPQMASAQSAEAPQDAEAQSSDVGVAEIVVTAQRRAESLQDVPISITALTSQSIQDGAIRGVDEIAGRTPGFTMTAFNVAQPRLFIRGSGSTDDGAAQDNSVAVFMDDVYIARGSGQAFEFLDVDRIEVLRGPQGTLYGKNVVGGLINVISRRPSRSMDAAAEISYGNYNALDLRGYVTGPVSDNLAVSFSGVRRSRDGFARNIRLNRDLEDLDLVAVRGQVLWTPTPDIDVLIAADYSNHSDNGQSRKGEGPFTTPPFGSVTAVQTSDDPRESESPRVTYQKRRIFG
ncbi:MAG: TonB-dependent receptor, partial [Sphingobium sp.]